jgi:ERCC4-related helicase
MMAVVAPTDPLEPGRVVRLRTRLWRVDRVEGEVFAATPLDGRENTSRRFHHRLEQVEPGELPFPSPHAVGNGAEQRRLLTAQRFGLVHGTAPILGVQRSRAIPTDYQLVPLLLSMGADRARLLIADSVGTGKTVEAGLVLAELLARGLAGRILVVVPASLRDQWRDALDHFFHLDATIVAGHLLPALERRLLPGQSVWSAHDLVVTSIDYVKTRTEQVLSHGWDVIVVDEAHLCAKPHTLPGAPEPDMARWQFVAQAARSCRHLLLLTATPHNGYSDSYASLFQMLDPALVEPAVGGPRIRRDQARHQVVQRTRRDIEAWYEGRGLRSPFPTRDPDEHIIDLTAHPEVRAIFDRLSGYTDALLGHEWARPINGWVAAHLQRRALSSPYALVQTLTNRLQALEKRATAEADRKATAEARASVADLFDASDVTDEQQPDRLDRAATSLTAEAETAWLEDLLARARRVTPAKDPKLDVLIRLAPRRMAAHPEVQRVIVFTKYTDTLDYLVKHLTTAAEKPTAKRALPTGTKILAIHGSLTLAERRGVFADFERAERAVLVATDCISEGLNLQHACAEVIHYELPWNPNRLEQRNGRVDRFHQREQVVGVRTLVYDDLLDLAILELIVKKSKEMLDEYGFVPPFLANPDILTHLTANASRHRLAPTLFEAAQLLDETLSPADLLDHERLERIKTESFYGQEEVTLGAVAEALEASRREVGSPRAVEEFFRASVSVLPGVTLVDLPSGLRLDGAHPDIADVHPRPRLLSFDPEAGFADPDVDVVDLAHPLLRRLVDLALDAARRPECPGRVAARLSPGVDEVTGVVWLLVRYLARADPPVLLEELVPMACPVWGEGPVPTAAALVDGPHRDPPKDAEEISEAAATLLARPDLPARIDLLTGERARLVAERHRDLDASWAAGLAEVEVMSYDPVAVTILYPEPRP